MRNEYQPSNGRVVKNTILLYLRTTVVMVVSLYTSRMILEVLGVEDYGIYNVVGGLVGMFAIMSASLTNAISRFITFELGNHDTSRICRVFSTSVNVQLIMAVIVLLTGELAGVWFLNYKMNIPPDRILAANIVLQCSLATFAINLISVPYNAAIIAHEKMNVFAYIGLLEVFFKFGLVYLMFYISTDKLVLYAVLMLLVALLVRIVYGRYCALHFSECHYKRVFDKPLLKEMFDFAGWNFLGTGSYIFSTQGADVLSNVFFGVAVNAARGVATQAGSAVRQFVNSFTIAVNPQIIKTYADKQYETCFATVRSCSKYSYYLMLYFFIPFVLEAETILRLWLKNVPDHAILFWQLTLVGILVDLPGAPITTLAQATGKIRRFYIWMGLTGCVVFPVSWALFSIGCPAYSTYVVYVVVYSYLVYVRLVLMKVQIGFPIRPFLMKVMVPLMIVTAVSFILPLLMHIAMETGILRLFAIGVVNTLSLTACIYWLGIEKDERIRICQVAKRQLKKMGL